MARKQGTWITAAAATGLALALASAPARAQSTVRASVDSAGNESSNDSFVSAISGNGRFVAFTGIGDDLVPFDTNGVADIFVHDLQTGATVRVSVSTAGVEGNSGSGQPTISEDGRFVAFRSSADNLVAGDTNGRNDIFMHDRKNATTWLASVSGAGKLGNHDSDYPAISSDGRFVAFESRASNLVAGDTNACTDAFVHDNVTGTTERASVDSAGVEGNFDSYWPRISGDGDRVAFSSTATNLVAGDTNGELDVFVHDHSTGTTRRVSLAWNGAEPTGFCDFAAISADGRFVAFGSAAPNLVPNDLNGCTDTFLVELSSGSIERVSIDSAGNEGSATSDVCDVSADGRFVAFHTWADDLAAGDTNGLLDVLVRDRALGLTWRASVPDAGGQSTGPSFSPSISDNGRAIVFDSPTSDLVAGDTNLNYDVFVRRVVASSWTEYGAGWPGTLGVPDLTAQHDPVLGTAATVDVGNSAGVSTIALLAVGYARVNLPTTADGTLLVDAALWAVLPLPSLGLSLAGSLPDDEALDGFVLDLQVLEADAGASHGISFSRGLELVLGR
jgi:Tol biopolymer transport system component